MNYGNIKICDVANGVGCRTSLFVSGCRNHCPGCFQKETWDFNYGEKFDEEAKNKILVSLEEEWCAGLSILGGEPLEPENVSELLPFVKEVKEKFPNKTIWLYTGFTYNSVGIDRKEVYELLKFVDVLVDGPFIESFKDVSLRFRGSSNQRLIDLNKTRKNNNMVVLWE